MSWGPNLVPLPGILYRHSAIQKAGDFDESLKYAMDLDMLLRLRKLGNFVCTGKTLAAFRWHTTSTTVANRQASLDEAARIKSRYLPKALRPLAPVWEIPVQLATKLAAKRVSAKQ
jgi:GT2 family glycosyltransferase